MDDYYLNMSNNLKKASYEDVDPSCLNLTTNNRNNLEIKTIYQTQKDHDFEYQDHFIDIDHNFNHENFIKEDKSQIGNLSSVMPSLLKQESSHMQENILRSSAEKSNPNLKMSNFLSEQREILQKNFNEKLIEKEMDRPMKYVMSEPKIEMRGSKSTNNFNFSNSTQVNPSMNNLQKFPAETQRNVKNTYIKKINSLINLSNPNKIEKTQSFVQKSDIKESIPEKNDQGNVNISNDTVIRRINSFESMSSNTSNKNTNNKKLENNRRSARNSRLRKKMYIELLENKVRQLNTEIGETKQILEQNNENFNSICHNSKYLNSLVIGKQQIFEKLEKLFSQEKPDEYQISLIIDSFRLRLGASGRERQKSIEYFFNQIIENFLPSSLKTLIQLCPELLESKPEGSFNDSSIANNLQTNFKNILNFINLTPDQLKNMKLLMRRLSIEKKKFDGFLKCLSDLKKNLQRHCCNLENIVDEISYSLNPIQIGKFLLTLEKERNRREFSVEKLWFGYQFDNEEEKDDGNSTPYSETFSVSAQNENIKRASNYNEFNHYNNEEEFGENSFFIDKVSKKTNLTFKYCSSPTSVAIKPSKTYQKYVQSSNGGLLKNSSKNINDLSSSIKYKNIFSPNSQSTDQFSKLELNKVYRIFNPTANSPIVIDKSKEGNVFINSDLKRKDSETGHSLPLSLKNNSSFENNSIARKSSSKSSLTPKSIQSNNSKLSQQKENLEDSSNNQVNNYTRKKDIDMKNLSDNKFLSTITKDKDEQLQKKLSDIFIKNNFNNPVKRNNYDLSKENPFSVSNRESLQFLKRNNIKNENNKAERLAGVPHEYGEYSVLRYFQNPEKPKGHIDLLKIFMDNVRIQ